VRIESKWELEQLFGFGTKEFIICIYVTEDMVETAALVLLLVS